MAASPQAQTALDEQIVDDRELEKALEDREIAKDAAGEARAKYATVDEIAKGKIGDLDLKDGDVVRVGRFRVSQKKIDARSVAFDVAPTSRLTISTAGEDE